MVEWLVQQGQQVSLISWRNPDAEQGHFDLDTYAGAVLDARDKVAAIADQPAVHLNGVCAGGMISAGVLGHLAAEGRLGQDTVRLAAGVHRDFIHLSLENSLTRAGELQVLGSGVDVGAVDLNRYILAGLTDHIIPRENAHRSTQLPGGSPRFVLSTSGHIQALVNPPGPDSRASYRVAVEQLVTPRRGPSAPPRRREAGGPTTTTGSPRAPARSSPRPSA
jgi:poly(3-hydroxyalkanoate) synthetase